jgi:hypothetical protein
VSPLMRLALPPLLLLSLCGCYATHHDGRIEAGREAGGAASLAARIQVVSGEVTVHRGAPGRLYDLELSYCRNHFTPRLMRDDAGPAASLHVGLKRRRRSGDPPPVEERNLLDIGFAPDVDLDLSLELGTGRQVADLGGLRLTRLVVAAGAAATRLVFDEPLTGDLATLAISGGPGRLAISRLGDASPAAFTLTAGAGEFEIDLSGAWRRDASIQIQVSLGDVTLLLPRALGVTIAPMGGSPPDLALPGFILDERGVYRGPGTQESAHRVAVSVEPGLGTLEARRID